CAAAFGGYRPLDVW
nr:immunoglobulin heavy chain junction region [Macaca mulatta]